MPSDVLADETYENLFEISQGKLDLFRAATDAFVEAAEEANIGAEPPLQENAHNKDR